MHFILLVLVIWLAGFLAFAAAIPPKVRDADRPVDAIVVLTGGDVRLAEGFALLDRGLAKKMLISGVSKGVELPALLQTLNGNPQPSQAVLDCCVTLGYDARSTEGNARESLRWLGENNFTTIRLVTANYHMNRSLLEFRRVMPQITITANTCPMNCTRIRVVIRASITRPSGRRLQRIEMPPRTISDTCGNRLVGCSRPNTLKKQPSCAAAYGMRE